MTTRLTDPCLSRSRSRVRALTWPAYGLRRSHVAAARKRSHQWWVSLAPSNTKTIGRMTCHCFLRPIRRGETFWATPTLTRFVTRSLRTRPHHEEGTRWTPGGGVLLISSDDDEDHRRIFLALNFRFREFLGRKIWQVDFGLILIGIIWDIQNYLNLSFCFYVIAETEDVLGCLGCMLLKIFKF